MTTTDTTTDTELTSVPQPYGTDKMDPLMYAMLVFVNAQNEDQMCMQTLSETLKIASKAGADNADAGTAILAADNEDVQKASKESDKDKASIDTQAAQSTMQYDNTRINNANQQFTTWQQSLETEENQLSDADQNETQFMQSFLGVYDNVTNIINGY